MRDIEAYQISEATWLTIATLYSQGWDQARISRAMNIDAEQLSYIIRLLRALVPILQRENFDW